MNPIWIWAVAVVVYGLFSLWYNNWSGAVTPEEIETYLKRAAQAPDATPERMAVIAAFFGCAAVAGGVLGSLQFDTPSGPSVVVAALTLFLAGQALGAVAGLRAAG